MEKAGDQKAGELELEGLGGISIFVFSSARLEFIIIVMFCLLVNSLVLPLYPIALRHVEFRE